MLECMFVCSIGILNETKGIPPKKPWNPVWWSDSPSHCLQLLGSNLLPLWPRLQLELKYSLLHPKFLFRKLAHGTKVLLLTSLPLLSLTSSRSPPFLHCTISVPFSLSNHFHPFGSVTITNFLSPRCFRTRKWSYLESRWVIYLDTSLISWCILGCLFGVCCIVVLVL